MHKNGAVGLRNDSSSILEAAKTISLAFSNDPLIRWLRPRERPWSDLDNASFKWQQRRVRRALHEAMVLRLQAVPHQLTTFEGQSSDKTTSSVSQKGISDKDQSLKFGTIAIIERPQRKPRPWWSKVFSWLYLRLLDTFDPAEDVGGSSRRIGIMNKSHDDALAEIRKQLFPREPWYIEVIAVRPSLRGQGFGRKLLQAVLNECDGDPVVLECTDLNNVGFYKKFGFQEVKLVTLSDVETNSTDTVTLSIMLKQ